LDANCNLLKISGFFPLLFLPSTESTQNSSLALAMALTKRNDNDSGAPVNKTFK